jgi:hypothetical protein
MKLVANAVTTGDPDNAMVTDPRNEDSVDLFVGI